MDENFEKALVNLIRNQLLENKQVTIEGLGTFRMQHQKQKVGKNALGRQVVYPPKDVVVFTSESTKP